LEVIAHGNPSLVSEATRSLDALNYSMCAYPSCDEQGIEKCARCGLVYYCSKACQKLDWKTRHKGDCHLPAMRIEIPIIKGKIDAANVLRQKGQLGKAEVAIREVRGEIEHSDLHQEKLLALVCLTTILIESHKGDEVINEIELLFSTSAFMTIYNVSEFRIRYIYLLRSILLKAYRDLPKMTRDQRNRIIELEAEFAEDRRLFPNMDELLRGSLT
jgi:hypothetical protein